MKVKRALISVSDKTGIIELGKGLAELGIEIISTGGTMKALQDAGVPVTYVSDLTGFPEIMDGRVKTLNPLIHGGILAIRDNPEHIQAMKDHNIQGIDLVIVNLYPFRQTVAKPDVSLEEAIENIDIGGPAMIRAAAKNFNFVTVVVNPNRYQMVLDALREQGNTTQELRMCLAKEAYLHTGEYDAYIAHYLAAQLGEGEYPVMFGQFWEKVQDLRYGENPHQTAAFYRDRYVDSGIANAKQLHGKELSFNNIVDMEAAYALVGEFEDPAAAVIKHTNPCGTGIGHDIREAYLTAFQADPVSAFGGIVAVNRPVDEVAAKEMSAVFYEVIIAPEFTPEALSILTQKKNIRLLQLPAVRAPQEYSMKKVSGGLLLQSADAAEVPKNEMKVVTSRQPSAVEWEQLLFAWKVVKHVKSNAIVVANQNRTLGVGAGQMNRVGAAAIALEQAGEKAKGAVLASDAFFPFADTLELAAKAGIAAIIQPGGSVRDEESIQAADKYGITMVFTGMRHFKH